MSEALQKAFEHMIQKKDARIERLRTQNRELRQQNKWQQAEIEQLKKEVAKAHNAYQDKFNEISRTTET